MTSQHKTNRISRWWEHVCAAICSHGLTWTNGTGGPSESEGLSWTARWNMWAIIICFEEKQSNAEGGIPVLTECHHHRGAPIFTFTLSPVLSLFYIPSAQTFLSHCIRGLFSGLLRAESEQHVGTGVRKPECRGATVSWWIPVLCPFRELVFPLTQLHKLTNEKDSEWALHLSILGSMCTSEV